MASFPHYRQLDEMSCGPTCLRIVAKYFGKLVTVEEAEELTYQGRRGVNLLGLCSAYEAIGLRTLPVQCNMAKLLSERRVPFLAHWNQQHFIVVYEITPKRIFVSDPAAPRLLSYSHNEFERFWASSYAPEGKLGIAVFFERMPHFKQDSTGPSAKPAGQSMSQLLLSYLSDHRQLLTQLCIASLLGSLLLFATPFLTEALVDQGVQPGDHRFVLIFLLAQIIVSLGEATVGFLRGWVLLYLSARISVSLVANFLQAAMNLPLPFFDKRNMGDILQRLEDHQRIEQFLTSRVIDSFFSVLIVVIYGSVIAAFSPPIFLVFFLGTTLSVLWATRFLAARQALNHRRFNEMSESRVSEVDLIRGIAEIKLTGSETQKRWAWEHIQVKLFKIKIASVGLEQAQLVGSTLINAATRALVLTMAADAVIDGRLTLGAMLAITAMLGQMTASVSNFLVFLQDGQDALLSLHRMTEVNQATPEDRPAQLYSPVTSGDIVLRNVSFRYGDKTTPFIIDKINLTIAAGKTTAIVGASGSGKSSLIKLLLKLYQPESGEITIGPTSLAQMSARDWRTQCGAVMQDGFIFSDTIARNIAVADERIDRERLVWAAEVAYAREFIDAMPLNYNTKVGSAGQALSGGQRQRLLIARAMYGQPRFLIFDEATSALDAHSEAVVSFNFTKFTEGITKLVVAHRLSTVRHADHIVVLERGKIIESGSHQTLTHSRGRYFELVRNQLELGT